LNVQFYIEQLVLWPVDNRKAIHTLEFHNGKINIIHGRSGTGKSSIIAIIDYCLGASRCAIPVGLIRDKVDWFGLVINVRGYKVLVARRTPGERQASSELFLKRIEDVLPIKLDATHTLDQIKDAFNKLVRLTNLPLAENEKIKPSEGRPSYRDLAAFNFLPQHIVANPNTLFYKADSYKHKDKLTKILPFALGIVDSEYFAKERESKMLQQQHDGLLKQQEVRRRALTSWNADVENLWLQCIELGLVKEGQAETIEKKIYIFQKIHYLYLENKLDEILQAPDYLSINQKFSELKTQEEELQKSTDALKREIRGYEQMARRASAFTEAVNLEKNRVINLDWLKRHLTSENECIVCGSQTNQLDHVISHLETEMGRVNRLSQALFENPIVDKEIESAKSKLFELQNQLHTVRSSRLNLEKKD
jgi:energy-coupling factor transporter ATP-binding protein EcfA2